MPAPPARQRSTRMPCGTSSTSIVPATIWSSLAVGVPGLTEKAAISFFTCLFSARIWPRCAPGSPSELHTRHRFFVPLSRSASIRLVANRWPTLKPAIAMVAPSAMSAMACSGVATVLSMLRFPWYLLFQSKTLDDAFFDRVLLARPAGVILGVEITFHLIVLFHRSDELRIVESFAERVVQRPHVFRVHAFRA